MSELLIYNIITWLGLFVIFIFQKNKIDALKTTIDAQKEILEAVKTLTSLFDVKDYAGYINLHKEKNKMEAEKLIEEERKNLNKNTKEVIKTVVEISEEHHKDFMVDVGVILFSLLLRIPPDKREEEVLLKEYKCDYSKDFIFNIIKNTGNNFLPILPFKGKTFGEMMLNSMLMSQSQKDY
jgi:hypothetical protein